MLAPAPAPRLPHANVWVSDALRALYRGAPDRIEAAAPAAVVRPDRAPCGRWPVQRFRRDGLRPLVVRAERLVSAEAEAGGARQTVDLYLTDGGEVAIAARLFGEEAGLRRDVYSAALIQGAADLEAFEASHDLDAALPPDTDPAQAAAVRAAFRDLVSRSRRAPTPINLKD